MTVDSRIVRGVDTGPSRRSGADNFCATARRVASMVGWSAGSGAATRYDSDSR